MPDEVLKPYKLSEEDIQALKLLAERERVLGVQTHRLEQAEGLVRAKLGIQEGEPLPEDAGTQYGLDAEAVRLDGLAAERASDETAALAALKTKYDLADGDTYDLTTGLITRS